MAVHVPVENKHAPRHVEKKPVLQAAAPERSTTTYKKADVIRPRGKEINESFSVQTRTETVLAERVQNFVATLEDSEVSRAALQDWQKQFLAQFKKDYPEAKTPEKLQEAALKFVRKEGGQGLVAALKIAEWELATVQRATGAYITDVQRPESRYYPLMQIAGREASVETPGRRFHRAGETDTRAHEDKRKMEKRPIWERDGNYYFDIQAGQNGRGRLVIGEGGKNVRVRYSFGDLDPAQKAFLARRGLMDTPAVPGVGGAPGQPAERLFLDQDAQVERQRIADLMTSITRARVDVYQATGRANMDLNMINRGNTAYLDSMSPHLKVEERVLLGSGGTDALTEAVNEIKTVTADMRKRTNEEAVKKLAQEREDQLKNNVDKQIDELGQDAAQTAAEQARLKELNASIPQLETQITTARRPTEINTQIGQLNVRRGVVEGQVNAVNANLVDDINNLENQRQHLNRLEARQHELRAQIASLENNLTTGRGRSAAEVTAITDRIRDYRQELEGVAPAGGGAPVGGVNNDINTLRGEIQATELLAKRPDVEAWMMELTRLNNEVKNLYVELPVAETAADSLLATVNQERARRGLPAFADVNAMRTDMETTLTNQRNELQRIEQTGLGRERQRQVFETYRAHVLTGEDPDDTRTEGKRSSIDGINVRAQNARTGLLQLEYSSDYAAYPEPYLRAIQVIFGRGAVLPGNEALFQEATRMLTPEMVLRIYNETNPGAPAANLAAIPPNGINPVFTTMVIRDLDLEARAGQLGQFSDYSATATTPALRTAEQAAVRPQFQRVALVPRDAAFDPNAVGNNEAERNRLTAAIYHYDDMDDLVRRIVSDWNVTGWGAGGFPVVAGRDYFTFNDTAIAQAKRFAEEIESRREWRRKLHGQQAAPETPPATP